MKIPTYPDILGAVAKGWCSSENEKKTMDPVLAEAISKEIGTLLHKEQPTMIKRLILTLTIVLLVAGTSQAGLQGKIGELLGFDSPKAEVAAFGAPESTTYFTAWYLTAPDVGDSDNNEHKARVGIQLDDTEFGLQLDYYGVHGASPGQQYGAYVFVHLDKPLVTDLLGNQYLGFTAIVVTEREDVGSYGPAIGALRPIAKNIEFGVEYQYRIALDDFPGFDKNKVLATLRFKF